MAERRINSLETLINNVAASQTIGEEANEVNKKLRVASALDSLGQGIESIDPGLPARANKVSAASEYRKEIILGLMKDYLGGYLDEIGQDKLARTYLSTPATETGNETHDEVVGLHKRLSKYNELVQKAQEGMDEGEFRNSAVKLAVEDVNKRLSAETDPLHKYLSEDTKNLFRAIAKTEATAQPQRYVVQEIGRLQKEIEGLLTNEEARARYAADNLRTYSSKGEKEKLATAEVLAGIYLSGKKSK